MSFGFSVLNVPVASLLQNFEGFLAFGVMSRWRNSLPEDVILYIHHTSHSRTGLGMKNIYETANWSLRQGDEGVNKRIKQKKYFLLITSSSFCRNDQFDISYIFFIPYWSRSTTGRSGTTHWFVAVDFLTFYISRYEGHRGHLSWLATGCP